MREALTVTELQNPEGSLRCNNTTRRLIQVEVRMEPAEAIERKAGLFDLVVTSSHAFVDIGAVVQLQNEN